MLTSCSAFGRRWYRFSPKVFLRVMHQSEREKLSVNAWTCNIEARNLFVVIKFTATCIKFLACTIYFLINFLTQKRHKLSHSNTLKFRLSLLIFSPIKPYLWFRRSRRICSEIYELNGEVCMLWAVEFTIAFRIKNILSRRVHSVSTLIRKSIHFCYEWFWRVEDEIMKSRRRKLKLNRQSIKLQATQ